MNSTDDGPLRYSTAELDEMAARITAYPEYLPAAERAALAIAVEIMIDKCFEAIEDVDSPGDPLPIDTTRVLFDLPPRYALQYDANFVRKFCVALVQVAGKLAGTAPIQGPLPATLAEELALHCFVEDAKSQWQEFLDVGAFDDADPTYRRPVDFDEEFEEAAFWDDDFRLLYSDSHDGIDESDVGRRLGMAPQSFDSWFTVAYGDYRVHPYYTG